MHHPYSLQKGGLEIEIECWRAVMAARNKQIKVISTAFGHSLPLPSLAWSFGNGDPLLTPSRALE